MEWVKIKTELPNVDLNTCSDKEAGRLLKLMTYCGKKENGGRIVGCGKWKRCKWKAVGCCIEAGKNAEGLWHWEGDDLVVDSYDKDAEKAAQSRRESASFRARKRWNSEKKANQNCSANDNLKLSKFNKTEMQNCNAELQCREEKKREKEINKEKEELLGIESPEIRAAFADMHADLKGRLSE